VERTPDLPDNREALRNRLIPIVTVRWTIAFVLLGLMLFLPAGTFHYWQAWVFLVVLAVPAFFVVLHYLRTDPELIERRMRMREKEREQRSLITWSYPLFLLAFILPGLDHRFGWSTVPAAFVIAADAIILCGYLLFVLVLKENRYASRVVEVARDQIVISTGPYALVRHPMYVSTLMIYLASPIALGSWWAMAASCWIILVLILRIRNEEEVLNRSLPGYQAYTRATRYRLVPGVW
jgi:protein-S-isoprenylcysteine O-methyltransferase Ste14